MCTGLVRSDDWVRLRAVARRMNERASADAHEVERAAIRMSKYIVANTIEITFSDDYFGVGLGSEWLVIDFKDGLEEICLPVSRLDPGANASLRKVGAEVPDDRAVVSR